MGNRAIWFLAGWLFLLSTAVCAAPNLIETIMATSDADLPALLTAHRTELTDDFLTHFIQTGLDMATDGNLDEAVRRTQRADFIDAWRDGKDYRASGQDTLVLLLLEQHRFDDAAQVARPLSQSYPQLYRPHFLLGTALFEKRDWDHAIPELKTATTLLPTSEEAHLELAYAYLYAGRPPLARQEFQHVLTIDPDNPQAADGVRLLTEGTQGPHANAAAVQHLAAAEDAFKAGRYPTAIAEYRRALDADPTFSRAAVYMGDAWLQLGDRLKAIESYQQAIRINPKDRLAWRFLGDVYERTYDETADLKTLDLAIDAYEHAVEIDPTYETAIDDLARAQAKKDLVPKN